MRSSSTNITIASNSSHKPNGKSYSSLNKPPIPPKPLLPSQYRGLLSDKKRELASISSDISLSSNYFPPPRYSTYPTAVLIKDEDIPYVGTNDNYDCRHVLETLTPLSASSCNEIKCNGLPEMTSQEVLPLLTKVEITPKYTLPQVRPELKANTRSGGRTLSATAKNALLMEKVGGSINSSKETFPRANQETSSTPSITVNKSCIISVNNFNNVNNNDNSKDEGDANFNEMVNKRRSFNHENAKFSVCSEVTINAVPIATSIISTAKVNIHNNVTNNLPSNKCFICNFQQEMCHCSQQESKKLSNNIDNKRKSIENTINIPRSNPEIFLKYVDEDLPLQTNEESVPITQNSSYDKSKARLSNASSSFSLSQSAPCSPASKSILQKSEVFDVEYNYCK